MKKRLRMLLAAALSCAIVLPGGAFFTQNAIASEPATSDVKTESIIIEDAACAPGQAIVCIKTGFESRLADIVDTVEPLIVLENASNGLASCELVLVKSSLPVNELLAELQACEGVEFAEPNYEAALSAEQTDSFLAAGSGSFDAKAAPTSHDYTSKQYAFNGEYGIDVPQWNTYDAQGNPTPCFNSEGKVVAVLDTGVDYMHADLRNAMWNKGKNYPTLVALGGGAYGINVAQPRKDGLRYDTTDPMDDGAHGTHIAGIIAGEWDSTGISGGASGAQVMAIKIMNDEGCMGIDEALRGYRYVIAAQRAGVPVAAINNSWGDETYSKALDLAAREAGSLGAVTVFAASNERQDNDMAELTANSFADNPYVVVVGNSNKQGQKSETSNFGKRSVDVFAPGQDIYSTIETGTGPGDEAASPLVAGGITYSCDFESIAVAGNVENGTFGFKGIDDSAVLSVANEGCNSAHSLSMGKTAAADAVTIASKPLKAGSACHGLCLWMKSPMKGKLNIMLMYNTKDGSTDEQHAVVDGTGDWTAVSFPVGETADKDNLTITLQFPAEAQEGPTNEVKVLIDNVKLVADTVPYDYMTGTSQSSPAVASGAAVLAAAFPTDDAAKRAARIAGSVKPVASLTDLCVSGGIFSLRKALAEDTSPVLSNASTAGSSVTVEGYFFGSEQGTLTIDGQALPVTEWSDTAVTAQLPNGFSGGEKLVELTASSGKKGHQRFRIGTPASLYRRLPLPGRSLFGDPGEYAVTSHEFDETFYTSLPRALVGLNGSLYYLLETMQATTAIYRYDIDEQTWELAYEGGYAAGGGACTWDGKILFIAGQPRESKTYFGLFDPATHDVEYTLYNSESFERNCTLVNTGKGVLLAGGTKFVYGLNSEPAVEIVRLVDPTTMTTKAVALPDNVKLSENWYASAYDEQGCGYLFSGTSTKGFYKFSFDNGEAACQVLEEGSVFGEKDGDSHALSVQAEGSMPVDQAKRMVAGPTKNGIIASGPAMTDSAGVVTADTYSLDWGQTEFKATDKLVSVTKTYNQVGTTYRGNFYVIADTDSEVGGKVFATQIVETIEQPGDIAQADPSRDSGNSKAAATTSKAPATGDALVPIAIALLCIAIGSLLVAVWRTRSLKR